MERKTKAQGHQTRRELRNKAAFQSVQLFPVTGLYLYLELPGQATAV